MNLKWNGDRCYYCGIKFGDCGPGSAKTTDHYIPKARGGPHEGWNRVAACFLCNHKKKDLAPEEFESSNWLFNKRIEIFRHDIKKYYRHTHLRIVFSDAGWECKACYNSGPHGESPTLIPCISQTS